jgi:hypothetical protein
MVFDTRSIPAFPTPLRRVIGHHWPWYRLPGPMAFKGADRAGRPAVSLFLQSIACVGASTGRTDRHLQGPAAGGGCRSGSAAPCPQPARSGRHFPSRDLSRRHAGNGERAPPRLAALRSFRPIRRNESTSGKRERCGASAALFADMTAARRSMRTVAAERPCKRPDSRKPGKGPAGQTVLRCEGISRWARRVGAFGVTLLHSRRSCVPADGAGRARRLS